MSLDVYLYFDVDVGHDEPDEHVVFTANVTHNLNAMASEAGVYECLWRPDEHGITTAAQVAGRLSVGLDDMRLRPDHYKAFNPSNGWGDYDGFVKWCKAYLDACLEYPQALVRVSR